MAIFTFLTLFSPADMKCRLFKIKIKENQSKNGFFRDSWKRPKNAKYPVKTEKPSKVHDFGYFGPKMGLFRSKLPKFDDFPQFWDILGPKWPKSWTLENVLSFNRIFCIFRAFSALVKKSIYYSFLTDFLWFWF